MSPSLYGLAVALVVLFVFCETGAGLKCYDCSSFSKERCAGDVTKDPELLIECPKKGNMTAQRCRKIEQQIYYDKKDNTRTFRACAYIFEEQVGCKERTGTHRYKSFYCNCDTDGCNGASTFVLPATLLAACLGLLQLFKHL